MGFRKIFHSVIFPNTGSKMFNDFPSDLRHTRTIHTRLFLFNKVLWHVLSVFLFSAVCVDQY